MNLCAGSVVKSKNGRDKGKMFAVLKIEGEYLMIADGETRPLGKPKRKKDRHVQPLNAVLDLNAAGPRGMCDADLRKWLRPFKED
ncbi:MAG: KOW domain-containing RNA-binding protein [Defluviitaleaceae bacterium]|nr:KOW domain-containing RNA-binding protein [Defluviitaleaceae bacterium]